ncbi:DUF3223 domain-containing protein [Pectobacterium carotovorum]|uniref:DUF3223 domain-containing protein n=1 Tax=Pectobacterium carotovorum TaxID=554 RepID=UPI00254ED56D|nr:DUF3223 domain-containing protein [Pectobacterium carotovorum]MDK9422122.1 DUF3223 domain-containing protein [Pectobacterium carotovorum]
MSYLINAEPYAKKKDIIEKAQGIIAKSKLGDDVIGCDYDFLIELFKNHNEWNEKSSNGVLGITVGKSIHGTTCFYLKTNSGLIDISFHHAIKCLKKI